MLTKSSCSTSPHRVLTWSVFSRAYPRISLVCSQLPHTRNNIMHESHMSSSRSSIMSVQFPHLADRRRSIHQERVPTP